MQQPYVSTLITQDFTSAEKSVARNNIDAISEDALDSYATKSWVSDNFLSDGDFSQFVTEDELEAATSALLTSGDLAPYATKSYVSNASAELSAWTEQNFYPLATNPSGYLTSATMPDPLPAHGNDQYLTTTSAGQYQWDPKPRQLPANTTSDRGRYLYIDFNDKIVWKRVLERTFDQSKGKTWSSSDDSNGYVDITFDVLYPQDEWELFFTLELSNFRASYQSSTEDFTNVIEGVELYLGNSTNPTLSKFAYISSSMTGSNGMSMDYGARYTLSHFKGSMITECDRITARLIKKTGITAEDHLTSLGLNYVQFV